MDKGESLKSVLGELLVTLPVTSLGSVDLFADHRGSQATRSMPISLLSLGFAVTGTDPQGN